MYIHMAEIIKFYNTFGLSIMNWKEGNFNFFIIINHWNPCCSEKTNQNGEWCILSIIKMLQAEHKSIKFMDSPLWCMNTLWSIKNNYSWSFLEFITLCWQRIVIREGTSHPTNTKLDSLRVCGRVISKDFSYTNSGNCLKRNKVWIEYYVKDFSTNFVFLQLCDS